MFWLSALLISTVCIYSWRRYRRWRKTKEELFWNHLFHPNFLEYSRNAGLHYNDLFSAHDGLDLGREAQELCCNPHPSPRLDEQVSPLAFARQGIGYCRNPDCKSVNQAIFVTDREDSYRCQGCYLVGRIVLESGSFSNKTPYVRMVRVEYNYDTTQERYRSLAALWDPEIEEERTNVYTIKSPIIKSEKGAFRVAESVLVLLQQLPEPQKNPSAGLKAKERPLDLDLDYSDFKKQCQKLTESWDQMAKVRKRYTLNSRR